MKSALRLCWRKSAGSPSRAAHGMRGCRTAPGHGPGAWHFRADYQVAVRATAGRTYRTRHLGDRRSPLPNTPPGRPQVAPTEHATWATAGRPYRTRHLGDRRSPLPNTPPGRPQVAAGDRRYRSQLSAAMIVARAVFRLRR